MLLFNMIKNNNSILKFFDSPSYFQVNFQDPASQTAIYFFDFNFMLNILFTSILFALFFFLAQISFFFRKPEYIYKFNSSLMPLLFLNFFFYNFVRFFIEDLIHFSRTYVVQGFLFSVTDSVESISYYIRDIMYGPNNYKILFFPRAKIFMPEDDYFELITLEYILPYCCYWSFNLCSYIEFTVFYRLEYNHLYDLCVELLETSYGQLTNTSWILNGFIRPISFTNFDQTDLDEICNACLVLSSLDSLKLELVAYSIEFDKICECSYLNDYTHSLLEILRKRFSFFFLFCINQCFFYMSVMLINLRDVEECECLFISCSTADFHFIDFIVGHSSYAKAYRVCYEYIFINYLFIF